MLPRVTRKYESGWRAATEMACGGSTRQAQRSHYPHCRPLPTGPVGTPHDSLFREFGQATWQTSGWYLSSRQLCWIGALTSACGATATFMRTPTCFDVRLLARTRLACSTSDASNRSLTILPECDLKGAPGDARTRPGAWEFSAALSRGYAFRGPRRRRPCSIRRPAERQCRVLLARDPAGHQAAVCRGGREQDASYALSLDGGGRMRRTRPGPDAV